MSSVGRTFTNSFGKVYGATEAVGNTSWDATRRATQGTYDVTKNYLRNKIQFIIFVKSYTFYGQVANGYLDVTKSLTFNDFAKSLEIDPSCIDKIEVDNIQVDASAQITKNFKLYVDLEKQPFYARDVALKLMVESMMKKGNMSFTNKLTRKAFAAAVAAPVAIGSAALGTAATLGTAAVSGALAIAFTGVKITKHGGLLLTAPLLQYIRSRIPVPVREAAYWGAKVGGIVVLGTAFTVAALATITTFAAVEAVVQIISNALGVGSAFADLLKEFLRTGGGISPIKDADGSERYFFQHSVPEILERMKKEASDVRCMTVISFLLRINPSDYTKASSTTTASQNRDAPGGTPSATVNAPSVDNHILTAQHVPGAWVPSVPIAQVNTQPPASPSVNGADSLETTRKRDHTQEQIDVSMEKRPKVEREDLLQRLTSLFDTYSQAEIDEVVQKGCLNAYDCGLKLRQLPKNPKVKEASTPEQIKQYLRGLERFTEQQIDDAVDVQKCGSNVNCVKILNPLQVLNAFKKS